MLKYFLAYLGSSVKTSNNQSLKPSTDVIQLTLTLKMTTAQAVETLVTVNNNSPIQDHVHPDDHEQSSSSISVVFICNNRDYQIKI